MTPKEILHGLLVLCVVALVISALPYALALVMQVIGWIIRQVAKTVWSLIRWPFVTIWRHFQESRRKQEGARKEAAELAEWRKEQRREKRLQKKQQELEKKRYEDFKEWWKTNVKYSTDTISATSECSSSTDDLDAPISLRTELNSVSDLDYRPVHHETTAPDSPSRQRMTSASGSHNSLYTSSHNEAYSSTRNTEVTHEKDVTWRSDGLIYRDGSAAGVPIAFVNNKKLYKEMAMVFPLANVEGNRVFPRTYHTNPVATYHPDNHTLGAGYPGQPAVALAGEWMDVGNGRKSWVIRRITGNAVLGSFRGHESDLPLAMSYLLGLL